MLFNSYAFVLGFLPLTLGVFALLTGTYARASAWFLVLASLAFYAWSSPWYHVGLLLLSIAFNFGIGLGLQTHDRGWARAARCSRSASAVDLAVLGYFKYSDFFLAQVGFLAQIGLTRFGRRDPAAARHLVLYLHPDRLSGRCLCQQGAGIRGNELHTVRDLVPASHRRPDHASLGK